MKSELFLDLLLVFIEEGNFFFKYYWGFVGDVMVVFEKELVM